MNATILLEPNPTQAPKIAIQRWVRAFGFPVKKLNAEASNPNTAASGMITFNNLDWIAPSVDSTLQWPTAGTNSIERIKMENIAVFDSFIEHFLSREF